MYIFECIGHLDFLWGITCSVGQLCPTLYDPMDSSPPGFSVYGIFQARIVEWVAVCYSRGWSSQCRDWTPALAFLVLALRFFSTTPPGKPSFGEGSYSPRPLFLNWIIYLFCIDFSRNFLVLGWWKSSFGFFCNILWKNQNELFG